MRQWSGQFREILPLNEALFPNDLPEPQGCRRPGYETTFPEAHPRGVRPD